MSNLVTDLRPIGTELPLVAFVRTALAPTVCVLSLFVCTLAYQEPFASRYAILVIVAFLVSLRVFAELPLAGSRSVLVPGAAILADWITVICVLLFCAFVTKYSALYSRKVVLTWFVITPFVVHGAQELARRWLCRHVLASAGVRTKVIVGVNDVGCRLARRIYEDPCLGVVEGFFDDRADGGPPSVPPTARKGRSEEHTSDLQSHSDIVYAVFCLKK